MTTEENFLAPTVPSFSPLHLISYWRENTFRVERVTVAVVLSSGIVPGGFYYRVTNNSRCLEFTVKWPKPIVDAKLIHKKWLQDEKSGYKMYHPELTEFQDALA